MSQSLYGNLPSVLQLMLLYLGEPFGSPFLLHCDLGIKKKKSVTRKSARINVNTYAG
jgi:hypothetical protein